VRITWLVVSERLAHMSDGTHHALGLYLDPIPWRPPQVDLPVGAAFLIDGDGEGPVLIVVRLLNDRGVWVSEFTGEISGRARITPTLRAGFLESTITVDAPGEYELQVLVDGQAVDDAPTWRLRFVAAP
jgi:hypothetical protein